MNRAEAGFKAFQGWDCVSSVLSTYSNCC